MDENPWRNYIFRLYIFKPSRAANSKVSVGMRSKFKLIQTFMHFLVTYKNDEYQIKNEGARVETIFLSFKYMVYIPDAQGQPSESWAKLKLIQAFMGVLITCKNEEDSIN